MFPEPSITLLFDGYPHRAAECYRTFVFEDIYDPPGGNHGHSGAPLRLPEWIHDLQRIATNTLSASLSSRLETQRKTIAIHREGSRTDGLA